MEGEREREREREGERERARERVREIDSARLLDPALEDHGFGVQGLKFGVWVCWGSTFSLYFLLGRV